MEVVEWVAVERVVAVRASAEMVTVAMAEVTTADQEVVMAD